MSSVGIKLRMSVLEKIRFARKNSLSGIENRLKSGSNLDDHAPATVKFLR